MHNLLKKRSLMVTILAVAFLFQIVSMVRYVHRLPEDSLGIGLYGGTIVALAVALAVILKKSS